MTPEEFEIYMEKCKVPKEYKEIIRKNKNILSNKVTEIRTIKEIEMTIELQRKFDPKTQKWEMPEPFYTEPYKCTPEHQEAINKNVKELEQAGIIEPASLRTYGWNHSPLIVKKKENEIKGESKKRFRMVIDFSPGINLVTRMKHHTIYRIEKIIQKLMKYKMFITIDVANAYYQIKIPERYREYTAFSTNGRKWRFTRAAMGLIGVPAVYARAMQHIFKSISQEDWFTQYFDDLTIGGNNHDELKERLIKVLECCKKYDLMIKLTKCEFEKKFIKILGWQIGNNEMKIQENKIKAIKEWEYPKNNSPEWIKTLETFVGKVNYLSKVIPKLSEHLTEIRNVIKNKEINNQKAKEDFEKIKKIIITNKKIGRIEQDKEAKIQVDASGKALGGVLLQQNEKGEWTPRGYFSYTLKNNELKWSTYKKEALAVRKGLEHFRNMIKYTEGKIIVESDCLPLVHAIRKIRQEIDEEVATAKQIIGELKAEIRHIKGNENIIANAISRKIPIEGIYEQIGEEGRIIQEYLDIPFKIMYKNNM